VLAIDIDKILLNFVMVKNKIIQPSLKKNEDNSGIIILRPFALEFI